MMNIKPAANRLGWGELLCVGAVGQSCCSGLRFNQIICEELNNEIVSLANMLLLPAGTARKGHKAATVN